MGDITDAVIEDVKLLEDGETMPILAEFQNGHFLKTENLVCKRVLDTETNRKYILVSDGKTVYKSPIGEGYGNSLTNSFIAFHNEETNKIRLIQVEEASLKSTHYDIEEERTRPMPTMDKETMLREFGGKNAIRYLDRVSRMKPNIDVVVDVLEKTVDQVDETLFKNDVLAMNGEDQEKLKNSIFPVVNKNAKSIREMYSLTSLIPNEVLEHLNVIAIEILKTDLDTVPFVNDYLKNCVKSVQLSKEPDSQENLNRVKMCLYADGLIRLINVKNPVLDKLELSKIAERIEIDIKERFAQADTKKK
jgi:hypothetical protein